MSRKYSEISQGILNSLKMTNPEDIKEFIKELRITLRLDWEIPSAEVRKMNDNKVIEVYNEIVSRPENAIGGSQNI